MFAYDTAATVILNTIVERITGVPFLLSMRERLLDPIGVSEQIWCVQTPEGTSWGGSGVICTLRDMAKLAYVCMKCGRWGDKQLISERYVQEATSKQIDNPLGDTSLRIPNLGRAGRRLCVSWHGLAVCVLLSRTAFFVRVYCRYARLDKRQLIYRTGVPRGNFS